MSKIVIRGAREHNLKGIDLDLPRDRLIVFTGLSGSGKSSLAFDTIYAEGQRRYVESMSAYARQFLERLNRPQVDTIEGLSPAISIEQRGMTKNPRSTVGTITELYDHIRLLYARVGKPHCPRCGQPITSQTVQQMVARVLKLPTGSRVSVLAPVVRGRRGALRDVLDDLRREGFARVNVDGELHDLAEPLSLDSHRTHTIEVYVDRLVLKPEIRSRLSDSLELALKLTGGRVKIATAAAGGADPRSDGVDLRFSEHLACDACDLSCPELTPRLFSFNNPQGACPRCSGLGALTEFAEERIVLDDGLSLREGAIEPWERHAGYYQQILEALARHFGFDLFTPYRDLPERIRRILIHGSGDEEVRFTFDRGGRQQGYRRPFEGVLANLQRRMEEQQRRRKEGASQGDLDAFDPVVAEFHRYMNHRPCPDCEGTRLRPEARQVLVGGRAIDRACQLGIGEALEFFSGLALDARDRQVADRLLHEIVGRLRFLCSVGLDYLTLDRAAASLSGGEGQRVRLATQIGAALVGVFYILDEPSVGLHQRDNARLLGTLCALRDLGNTVLVVEHDEETIRAADHVVDLGPGAGDQGGELVAAGSPAQIIACERSLTGQYLGGERSIAVPARRRRADRQLMLRGASHNNLRELDVAFPLGTLTCVTGVSGSGKSSLVVDTLLPALRGLLHGSSGQAGAHRQLSGGHQLDKVVAVDQGPIGRTPRSNPATYTGLFAPLRELLASLPESRVRGYKPGRFSFNVKGGRCEACKGDGVIRIEMHFLPDVHVPCEVCEGKRYNSETLGVRYRGYSIADLLAMRVSEARALFDSVPKLRDRLQTLCDVGLGYVALGQPASTLSGGEAQRVKLSRELARRASGRTMYILDEPTTGLHIADIDVLLQVLARLVDDGNTVIVIEHNIDVIKTADHVIDLGPEGGGGGGRVLATGTPEQIAACEASYTGRYLRPALEARQ